MAPRKVCILILTWNGLNWTRRCLDTLRENTRHPAFEVLVVDNGSTDGTLEYLRGLDWVRVLENGTNLGFVRGNNRGLRTLGADVDVVLLNNDIEILQPDWLDRLQATAYAADDIGVVGCRLRYPDGRLQHAGTCIWPDEYRGHQFGGLETDINQYNADREVEGVVFACAYLKRAVLEAVGLLDEAFFSYFEDTDYCLRARAAGFRTICCGSVTLVHHQNVATMVNRTPLNRMLLTSRKTFCEKWGDWFRQHRYQRRLAWRSILNFSSGYALSSRELARALDRQGIEVSYRYAYGPGTPFPLREPRTDDYFIDLLGRRAFPRDIPQVVYAQGDVFARNSGAYRIGYTMLETTGIPAEWVRQANAMDEVWVPSTFNVQTFRGSGVYRPIHVIPLGVDPNYFNPGIVGHRLPGVYTFLSIFEWGERKAPEILLRAFTEEFDHNEDVVLLCKVINRDASVDVFEEVEKLNLRRGGGRVLLSVNDVIPAAELGSLYRSADCFVLSTRGEGWGMPILEAMACGLPVIATDWSASRDFFNEGNGYPLQVERLVPARAKCPYYEGFSWAEPSGEHLRCLMRRVFERPEEARALGLAASREVLARWTWDAAAARIVARLEAIEANRGRRAA